MRYECRCCRYPTLRDRGSFEICALCCWEDDGQDDLDAAIVKGGPNHDYSLAEARENFQAFMCQFRPAHSRFFAVETSSSLVGIKKCLIDTFEVIRSSPQEVLAQLWQIVELDEAALSAERATL